MRGVPSSSDGFGGMGPQGMRSTPGTSVFSTTSSSFAAPMISSVRPWSRDTLNARCSRGRRRSESISSTRLPPCAKMTPRLITAVDLPSCGPAEVTSSRRNSLPAVEKMMFVRIERTLSVIELFG